MTAFMKQPLLSHVCELCGERGLIEFADFTTFPRVTSDSRMFPSGGRLAVCVECGAIQKPADERWLSEINHIYSTYRIYHQSGGAEQPIFDVNGGGSSPRSVQLVDFLIETLRLGAAGEVLDFGCGNGTALRSFGARRPGWRLYGSELSDLNLDALKKVPGFEKLYTVPPSQIEKTFDLIMLFHALEHVVDPVGALRNFKPLLSKNAAVFVEVPDNAATPYDLLIADHKTHFTKESLGFAAARAGFDHILLSDQILPKELSWIGMPLEAPAPVATPDPAAAMDLVERHIASIAGQMGQARSIADDAHSFGVFGTSISATWLSNVVGDKIAFYVDEDPARAGRNLMGKPILKPADVPTGSDVFIPLIPKIAASVERRHQRPGVHYHRPASAGSSTISE